MKRCPQCQFQTDQNDEMFCGNCGTKLENVPEKSVCNGCGAELKPGLKFCTKCGTKVEVTTEKTICKQGNIMEQTPQGEICRFSCEDCGITVLCEDITLGAECFACGRKYLKDDIFFQIKRDLELFSRDRNNAYRQLDTLPGLKEHFDSSLFHSGAFEVYSGCSVINAIVDSRETSYVNRGGKALQVLIKSGGRLLVWGGGFADDVVVRSGGKLCVSSGGTATNVRAEGGANIAFNAVASNTLIRGTSNGNAFELKDGHFSGIPVPGDFDVYSGCSVTNAIIKSRENAYVNRGGKALQTRIESGGRLLVWGGGSADDVVVRSGGKLCVSSGGTATNIRAENGAKVEFDIALNTVVQGTSNGTAITKEDDVTKGSSHTGAFDVSSGCIISNAIVDSRETSYVNRGGKALQVLIKSGGRLLVWGGGFTDDVVVRSGGKLCVSSGGTATNVKAEGGANVTFNAVASNTLIRGTSNGNAFELKDGHFSDIPVPGDFDVYSGCSVTNAIIKSRENAYVNRGGKALQTRIESGGRLLVCDGGSADDVVVRSGGKLCVSSGGTATNVRAEGGANVTFNAVASNTLIRGTSNGNAFELKDGHFSGIPVPGDFDVYSGCSVTNAIIKSRENAYVNRGGKALQTRIESGGRLLVWGGGSADDVVVRSGGKLCVSSGGTATNIRAENGAKVEFDIALNTVVQGTSNGQAFKMKDGR